MLLTNRFVLFEATNIKKMSFIHHNGKFKLLLTQRYKYYYKVMINNDIFVSFISMAPRKGKTQQTEQVVLGPQVKEGENVFGVAHIFASFNDTFVHVTDLSGK